MPRPALLKPKQEVARDDKSTLYEKEPGKWFSTCPDCGTEHDVSGDVIDANKQPECCGWKWRLFDQSVDIPRFDPAWVKNITPSLLYRQPISKGN